MGQVFFGQFLLNEGVVSDDDLQLALDTASKDHMRIGALGVERGWLSEDQVEQIQLEQRNTDRRFAELAVDLEMLSRSQADSLLREQKQRHKPLGEALVELGVLDATELDDLLDRYHLSLVDLEVGHLGLPLEIADDDLATYLVAYLPKLYRRVTHVPMKIQTAREWLGRSNLPHRVSIEIEGDGGLVLGLAACPELAQRIARALFPRDGATLDDVVIGDALQAFAEILADAGRRSARADGLDVTVAAPRVGRLPESGYWLPATTPFGRGILVLANP